MRQITAAEVKPGMEVQFDLSGWDVKGTVGSAAVSPHAVWIYTEERCEMSLDLDTPVTVLAEPHPEEPTTFGARVVVGGECYLRAQQVSDDTIPWLGGPMGRWYRWRELLGQGQVTIIDADPSWTVPAEAPEVPERIEEWPEDDEALRAYRWRDCYKNVLDWNKTRWRKTTPSGYSFPVDAAFEIDVPCTRVADA